MTHHWNQQEAPNPVLIVEPKMLILSTSGGNKVQ
uniref:Uncharacterized protein n=1 Tax=Rhizophora mucronata TaxID=61149 RepID=A0A2P2IJM2_RHIMU